MSKVTQAPFQAGLFSEAASSQPSTAERIHQLKALIREHDYQYYVLDAPSVSDNEYDGLFQIGRAHV